MSAGIPHWDVEETIIAIASGATAGRRGIVRLTGANTVAIVQQMFQPEPEKAKVAPVKAGPHLPERTARRLTGTIAIPVADETMAWPADLWLWPTARTYTGQPSAELHLLGAPLLLEKVVQLGCRAGARLAGPGEFTMRAFLSGRLDLMQAEAVLQVIHAHDPERLATGLRQLAGGLSHPLSDVREKLVHLLAHLEAGLDFAEEDIEFISQAELTSQLEGIQQSVAMVLEQIRLRDDRESRVRVVLLGSPNAGKSSLFNTLLNQSQALVSNQRGTTRDYLRQPLKVGDHTCLLVDTAGLDQWLQVQDTPSDTRETSIDWMAEQSAVELIQQADVCLLCREPADTVPLERWQKLLGETPTLLVLTKSDVTSQTSPDDWRGDHMSVSSQTGQGIPELRRWLERATRVAQDQRQQKTGGLGLRAQQDLESVQDSLAVAVDHALAGGGEELVAAELRIALESLGKLVGTIYTDDLLDSIFSRFCIGK